MRTRRETFDGDIRNPALSRAAWAALIRSWVPFIPGPVFVLRPGVSLLGEVTP
jgi:hypothetical protein